MGPPTLLEPRQDPAQTKGFLFFPGMLLQQICLSRHLSVRTRPTDIRTVVLGTIPHPFHHPGPRAEPEAPGRWALASAPVNSGQGPSPWE